jgi:catechol 2,3-dioxygenase-like lactoylglutathione lyase family enzyme
MMGLVLDHVSIQCADVGASIRFYEAVLAPLGVERLMQAGEAVGFGIGMTPSFWVGPHATGQGFRETHLAFKAPDREAVRAFYRQAMGVGAAVLYEPQLWPRYDPEYYAAFVRDPEGNNVEAVCRHSP